MSYNIQELSQINGIIYNIKSLIQRREKQKFILQEFILDTIEPDRVLKRSLEDLKECRKRKFVSSIYNESLFQLNILNRSLAFLNRRLDSLQEEINAFARSQY